MFSCSSEHYGSEAGSHDSTLSSGHDISPHMKYSKSGNFGIYVFEACTESNFHLLIYISSTLSTDQSASPTPPYMPIQGTRRSNSSEDRKKKSKDNKCTHQWGAISFVFAFIGTHTIHVYLTMHTHTYIHKYNTCIHIYIQYIICILICNLYIYSTLDNEIVQLTLYFALIFSISLPLAPNCSS